MFEFKFSIIALIFISIISSCTQESNINQTQKKKSKLFAMTQSGLKPPIALIEPKILEAHNDKRVDNYYWMNQREDQRVLDYLTQENEYRESITVHLKESEENLYKEMKARIQEKDESVPYKSNGYYYRIKYDEANEYPTYVRYKKSLTADEELILDVNKLAEGFDYFNVGTWSVSDNNRLMFYAEDTLSRRIYTIRIKNLETGEMLDDMIPNTSGNAVWAADNKTIFYAIKDEALRPYKIMRHKLGTPVEQDVEVYYEANDTFRCGVTRTRSRKFILVGSFQTVSTEYSAIPADQPENDFVVLQPRERNHEYFIDHFNNSWFVRTNKDAVNFKVMHSSAEIPIENTWQTLIPHRENVLLEDITLFDDYLVLDERVDGLTKVHVKPWNGRNDHYIDFDDEAYLVFTSVNRVADSEVLRIGYQSMTTPSSTYDYNMRTRTLELKNNKMYLENLILTTTQVNVL